jgi:hypothetical protein
MTDPDLDPDLRFSRASAGEEMPLTVRGAIKENQIVVSRPDELIR